MKNTNWSTSDTLSVIAIVLSILFSILTLVLNAREDPTLMPYAQNIYGNRLVLDFNNFSESNLRDVSILISGFNFRLDTIPSLYFEDKFLFTVSAKSTFNYGFNLGGWARNDFYFRVRLKGKYNSRFPICSERKFEQTIWYSAVVQEIKEDSVRILLSTTHKDQIDSLESKFKVALEEGNRHIDRRFQN